MPSCPVCGEDNSARARFCQACGRPLTTGESAKATRRLVTIVFCDVIGSTAFARGLDAESLRGVFARYFEEMRGAIQRHGGSVEKFIGDAVMAVFGLPRAHEDDALRAVRAAVEMRAALAPLNQELERVWGVSISVRIGVNTGVVVAGGESDALVTGEPVVVAARLEQAATPGDILLGPETYRLVRDAVASEPVEALELKGLGTSVQAHRLLSVTSTMPGRRLASPLVGREAELAALRAAFDRAKTERRCELAIVLGQAGVGKTRLIEEVLATCRPEATVLTGRCLPYGEGIAFWPLAEVLTEAAGLSDADAPEIVRRKIDLLLAGVEQGPRVADRVAQAIGVSGGTAAPEETLWAIRTLFEHLARPRPLILVFHGVQWAETTFLTLIEHVTERSRDAPILLVCEGRDETKRFADAVRGRENARFVRLRPLAARTTARLVENLLGTAELVEDVRRRIVEAAGGLPLYAEEIISMMIDEGHLRREDGHWVPVGDPSRVPIPTTIHALLTSRLDGLPSDERAVLDRASIVGMRFTGGEVAAVSEPAAGAGLASGLRRLVTKGFIRHLAGTTVGENEYEFRHVLFREVTYASLAKHERAELHERYAGWLEEWSGPRIEEYEEIVAHHLDQAVLLRRELGRPDERTRRLADRAGARYASAGRRASARGDIAAVVALLGRAVELLPHDDRTRMDLIPHLVAALVQTGDLTRSSAIARDMATAAAGIGDPSLEARAALTSSLVRSIAEPGAASVEGFRRIAANAAEVFEARGERGNLAAALAELAWSHGLGGDAGRMLVLAERALALATEAGDAAALRDAADCFGRALVLGPTPCDEAVRKIDVVRGDLAGHRVVDASIRLSLGELLGMMGRFSDATAHVDQARLAFDDLGQRRWLAAAEGTAGLITWWSGSAEAAEADLRSCYEFSRERGGEIWGREAANFARLLLASGRVEEADHVTRAIADGTPEHEVESQIVWRSVRGLVFAARGDLAGGVQLAHQAVRLAEATDFVSLLASALLDLARCRRAAGEPGEAELVDRATALFEGKGDRVGASNARGLLAAPEPRSAPYPSSA
ncbi:MAG TPA: adenylate/guanylate cyclase domain-containing protein [Actinomycetota bacterium]|nr:adenylate/guanylate cyclase domain-containing protein [Actinomycetota bacterium]